MSQAENAERPTVELTTKEVGTLEWWTCRELANRWRVSVDSIERLLKDKQVEGRKIGGTWRIHITAIHAYESPGIPKEKREARFKPAAQDFTGRRPAKA